MITLYAKTGCPYCKKVIDALDLYGLSFVKLNSKDDAVVAELLQKGGKRQFPYLIDGDIAMYESDAIVDYLEKTYGSGAPTKLAGGIKIHSAGGTSCPA